MRISKESLQGYILEEVLAHLIKDTGYRLLVDEGQDPLELASKGNGLVVKGRGGDHQVDVLGELSWIPTFTYPLRLFVEAKYRKGKTGIREVRNMVATLLDVNQNNFRQAPSREDGEDSKKGKNDVPHPRPKYHYAGVIFSTAGFSQPAMDMAAAHAVSLVQLSETEFQPLLDAISRCATILTRDETDAGIKYAGKDEDIWLMGRDQQLSSANVPSVPEGEPEESRSQFILAMRTAFRRVLKTQTYSEPSDLQERVSEIIPKLLEVVSAAREIKQLFVGMGRGPYMLVLKADSPEAFLAYARRKPSHDVSISWGHRRVKGEEVTWYITPADRPDAYRLSFRVPQAIVDWIFSEENVRKAARNAKTGYFSNITIYHSRPEGDLVVKLKFRPKEMSRPD